MRHAWIALLVFAGIIGVDALLFKIVPGGFVPPEDQGYILGSLTLPDAATLQRTQEAGAARCRRACCPSRQSSTSSWSADWT